MIEALVAAVVAISFHVPVSEARLHVEAALAAARAQHAHLGMSETAAVELLLGMAYVESRYNPLTLSRRERTSDGGYRRVTGTWTSDAPPPNAKPSWFCGPLQTGGRVSWEECQRMRTDLTYGYAAGVNELVTWFRDPRCRDRAGEDRLVCALHGHGGGYPMIKAGTHQYPHNVLLAARRIHQFASYAQRRASS